MINQSDFAVWKNQSPGVAFFAMVEDELSKVEKTLVNLDFTKDNTASKAAYLSGIKYALEYLYTSNAEMLDYYSEED